MEINDWHKCYRDGWRGAIVSEAFAHPAKFSRALIRRIYEHCFEEGWLKPSDIVLDPFGGVALGALHAMKHGLSWIGVELEEKFVALGQQNIDLWNERYSRLPGWGTAMILQGDSRNLAQVMAETGAVVSSPPFQGIGIGGSSNVVNLNRQCVSKGRPESVGQGKEAGNLSYGSHPGQLAALPEGDYAAAIVSSPPFARQQTGGGIAAALQGKGDYPLKFKRSPGNVNQGYQAQGQEPGQLGQMRDGGFAEACVSSPPYEACPVVQRADGDIGASYRKGERGKGAAKGKAIQYNGSSKANLGNKSGDTFWSASRTILEQVYQVLIHGGHAIFVTKSFVRKDKRVDFPGQWRELCEAIGFTTLHVHRAWLVEKRGAQYTLKGELEKRRVEHKSFFRRLAEKKGSPHIDWETVICLVKD